MEIELKDDINMSDEKEDKKDIVDKEDEEEKEDSSEDKISPENENIEIELINDGETPLVKKSRKKRRTKDEIDGRNHICSICQKAYLSYPALTNHRKSKHSNYQFHTPIVIDDKKKRGRPKKNLFANFVADYENKIKNFFDYDPRKITQEIKTDIKELTNSINIILGEDPILKSELENTKFLQDLIKINANEVLTNSEIVLNTAYSSIDMAFSDFIKFSHTKTSDEYLIFLIKFALLFRKCIMCSSEKKIETSIASSDLIPDYSNDFFIFMSENNFFNLNSDENKLEMASLMQYFCQWLLENNYTKSKIFILQK